MDPESVTRESTASFASLAPQPSFESPSSRPSPARSSAARVAPGAGRPADPRALLVGASPKEVLARIVASDPLRLRERVAVVLAERCYVLDADEVFLRAAARVARFSTRYRGEPALDKWLRTHVDDAVGDCLERDLEPQESSSAFVELARPLGLEPERMRRACSALNARDRAERAAFIALVLDRRELEEAAAALRTTPTECARAARRALEACMAAATAPERRGEARRESEPHEGAS